MWSHIESLCEQSLWGYQKTLWVSQDVTVKAQIVICVSLIIIIIICRAYRDIVKEQKKIFGKTHQLMLQAYTLIVKVTENHCERCIKSWRQNMKTWQRHTVNVRGPQSHCKFIQCHCEDHRESWCKSTQSQLEGLQPHCEDQLESLWTSHSYCECTHT